MYIVFDLPGGAGGQAAYHAASWIHEDLGLWAKKYNIPFQTKLIKNTLRLNFDNPENYTFFALTWDPRWSTREFRTIEPMARPQNI